MSPFITVILLLPISEVIQRSGSVKSSEKIRCPNPALKSGVGVSSTAGGGVGVSVGGNQIIVGVDVDVAVGGMGVAVSTGVSVGKAFTSGAQPDSKNTQTKPQRITVFCK